MKRGIVAVAGLALTAAAAAPHKVVRDTPALEFSYEWPAEAVAIPALDLKLFREAKAELAEAQKYAAEDQALARKQKRGFNRHYFSGGWESAGETPRLLSLEGAFEAFAGGAHPSHDQRALLWDRKLNRRIAVGELFARAGAFEALTRAAYCKALDQERAERRSGEKLDGEFAQCPKYSELVIVPSDANNNGRFDTIDLIAPEYVAGPYVEGDYLIELPVTTQLISALKPAYRNSFEAQRQ
jgi:hypothetical protein